LVEDVLSQASTEQMKVAAKLLHGLAIDSEIRHFQAMAFYREGKPTSVKNGDEIMSSVKTDDTDRAKGHESLRRAERIFCWEKIIRRSKGENFEDNVATALDEVKRYVSKPPKKEIGSFFEPVICLFDTISMFAGNKTHNWIDEGLSKMREVIRSEESLLSNRINAIHHRSDCILRRLGEKDSSPTVAARISDFVEYQVIERPRWAPDGDSLDELQKNISISLMIISLIWVVLILSLSLHPELSVNFAAFDTSSNAESTPKNNDNNQWVLPDPVPPEPAPQPAAVVKKRTNAQIPAPPPPPPPPPPPTSQTPMPPWWNVPEYTDQVPKEEEEEKVDKKAKHNVLGLVLFVIGALIVLTQLVLCLVYYFKIFVMMLNTHLAHLPKSHNRASKRKKPKKSVELKEAPANNANNANNDAYVIGGLPN
jgi:hypothetical protein